jgi:hypothetical protein
MALLGWPNRSANSPRPARPAPDDLNRKFPSIQRSIAYSTPQADTRIKPAKREAIKFHARPLGVQPDRLNG